MSLYKIKKGFTLIELLVVCGIIAVLATVVTVNYKNAKVATRDSRRIADIESIRSALEMYYDGNDTYPISTGCGATEPNSQWCNSFETLTADHWIEDTTADTTLTNFLPQDPVDPKPATIAPEAMVSGGAGVYFYHATQKTYALIFMLENKINPIKQKDGFYPDYWSVSGGTTGVCCANGFTKVNYDQQNDYGSVTLGATRGKPFACDDNTHGVGQDISSPEYACPY